MSGLQVALRTLSLKGSLNCLLSVMFLSTYDCLLVCRLAVPARFHHVVDASVCDNALEKISNQTLVCLVGIPGSGKSTLALKLESILGQRWQSFNQDQLGSRKKVFNAANRALGQKLSVIIDRCNHDESQRKHWLDLAQRNNINKVICVVLPRFNDLIFCAERARLRGDDGIHDLPDSWERVCGIMNGQFVYPRLDEGFTAIYQCIDENDVQSVVRAIESL